jgi:hypothetical protein
LTEDCGDDAEVNAKRQSRPANQNWRFSISTFTSQALDVRNI